MRTLFQTAVHQLANLIELRPRVNRADVGVFVERIAEAESRDAIAQLANDGAENAFLHKQSRTSTADVTLIEINSGDYPFHCLVN